MSDSKWAELDHIQQLHRAARNYAQISAKGPPPEQWYRRWTNHSILHTIDVSSGDALAGTMLALASVGLGALSVYLSKWLLARLSYLVLYSIAAIFVLTPQKGVVGFAKAYFVIPAFSAESLEHRIMWAASFYVLKDALEYILPSSLKEHEMMPGTLDIIMVISSLWNLDVCDRGNKALAWKCTESPRLLSDDNILDTAREFTEYHIKMSASIGMLMASIGVIAGRILIGALAVARLVTATNEDAENEMNARHHVTKDKKNQSDPYPDMCMTLLCFVKISCSGPPPMAWYLRWKDHTIIHIFSRFPTDRTVLVDKYSFARWVISSCFVAHLMKWIYFKMVGYLPISILYIIAAIFIGFKVELLWLQRIPVFGCYCLINRLCWAASFTAAYDVMKLLPESWHLAEIHMWDVVMSVSGIWYINQGDYFCKILSWEYTSNDSKKRCDPELNVDTLFRFRAYLNIISRGIGSLMASCGLITFSWAMAGVLISQGYDIWTQGNPYLVPPRAAAVASSPSPT
ncbi:hypothetical protein ACHAWF_009637 [Thalassiosira exigua]